MHQISITAEQTRKLWDNLAWAQLEDLLGHAGIIHVTDVLWRIIL